MKFLCLHGAIGNIDNLSVQINPLVQELRKSGTDFHFAQGGVQVDPPEGFQEYFGPGPHYRFFNDQGVAEHAMLQRVRNMPQRATPEETMRALRPTTSVDMDAWRAQLPATLAPLYDLIDADDDIQGIIGYSEGAVVASTLLLDEQRRFARTGREKRIKCALFFSGWPPIAEDGSFLLADERDDVIEARSVHVIGANDPFIPGSMSLYNVFDEDGATIFDHGKGHTIPRDPKTVRELADAIRDMMGRAGVYDKSGDTSDSEGVSSPNEI